MVASGLAWETIVEQCHNSVIEEAIAEAVSLASKAFLEHAQEYTLEPIAA
jgi:heme oxygenase